MIRILISVIALSLTLQGCNGQKNDNKKQIDENQPQTNIKVNKEYDKNGNLVRYDSSYSYYYSNIKNDTAKRDSIFELFKNQFNHQYFFSNEAYFNDFFFQDSLLEYDFYKRDFFTNRFRNNMRRMDSLFWNMDVMKDEFFRNQTPNNNIIKKK